MVKNKTLYEMAELNKRQTKIKPVFHAVPRRETKVKPILEGVSKEIQFAGLIFVLLLLACILLLKLTPTTSFVISIIGFVVAYVLALKYEKGRK